MIFQNGKPIAFPEPTRTRRVGAALGGFRGLGFRASGLGFRVRVLFAEESQEWRNSAYVALVRKNIFSWAP